MLAGKKPLAIFSWVSRGGITYEEAPEEEFDPHVSSGLFVKGELQLNPNEEVSVRYVFYALKSESWRISAIQVVLQQMQRMRRVDEGVERIRGALLGYSDEEIDAYVKASKHLYGNVS
jgi:hypothetical protein